MKNRLALNGARILAAGTTVQYALAAPDTAAADAEQGAGIKSG